jgi:hypothetical protein
MQKELGVPMKRAFRFLRASVTIFVAVTVFGVISLAPESPPAQSQAAVAVALAPILLKALPSIATVVGNLFKPKTNANQNTQQQNNIATMKNDSKQGGQQLELFVKRTQIL